nr:hypothetical protein [Tanacetum cinerariifolium]
HNSKNFSSSTNPQNTNRDATFDEKEPEFEGRKPESEVNVSPSSSAQSKKHDDKTKREAKGKSHVESLTGYRNLSAVFEDFSNNNINDTSQLSLNSTNTFSVVGPSNAAASPTHGKSSFIDTSQLPDDPSMPELEDITYSDDEDDVVYQMDVKSSFLYKTIEEEVYVCQSLRFEYPDYPDKVYRVVNALYCLHQAPRAWGAHKQYAQMTLPNPHRHVVPAPVLTHSKLVPINVVRPVTTAVPKPSVTRPRHAKTIVTKPTLPPRRHINRSPSLKASNFPPKVTVVKAPMVNAATEVIDSGCSRHMKGNMSYLSDFEELNGGYVAFGELKFNLFSVSQMCDKKNSVLFTDTECLILSPDFKLPDENQVLLRVPRENNMYNDDLKNIIPFRDLTCLFVEG